MADEKKNLLPLIKNWSKAGNTASTISYGNDGYSCTWTATQESDYIYYKMAGNVAGKKFFLTCDEFKSSDNEAWINVRGYTSDDNYTNLISLEGVSGSQSIEIDVAADVTTLRICFRHQYASSGIDPAATLTLTNVCLYEEVIVESLTALNFHKVLAENLPDKVEAGTQHVYYVSDGTTVREYIANKEGYLVSVGYGSSSASTETETKYTNVYTQQHIDERKDDIMKLVNAGHCVVFAIATDIHVRIEDGDAGRYNQVRDFIMVSEQLPIDYIICEGDIMSYCQEWDGVYEPRCDNIRKIFNKCRCPWYVTRGNHDYNSDDNGYKDNSNIKEYNTETADKYFITDRAWNRTISAKMPFTMQHRVHFDQDHPQNGYFYVDDFEHKHRIIMCNSEETMETDTGHIFIKDGQIDAYISGVQSLAQVDWLINKAMNFSDKEDRSEWVVSFHSHTVPYSDMNETDKSEFHGYGWDNPEIRSLVVAFMNGTDLNFKYTVIDVDKHEWQDYTKECKFSTQGPIKVLGWFGGHCHDDCYRKVNGLNVDISTCTCSSRRDDWSKDPSPTKLPPERNSTDKAMSMNIFIVNLDERKINMIKLGSKRDNTSKTSSDLEFTY